MWILLNQYCHAEQHTRSTHSFETKKLHNFVRLPGLHLLLHVYSVCSNMIRSPLLRLTIFRIQKLATCSWALVYDLILGAIILVAFTNLVCNLFDSETRRRFPARTQASSVHILCTRCYCVASYRQ